MADENYSMAKNSVLGIDVQGSPMMLSCIEGLYWLTCEGDSADYFAGPGESLTLHRGNWAAQAMRDSRCTISDAFVREGGLYGQTFDISVL